MSPFQPVNPPQLGAPRGYAHGLLVPAGARTLFVAGQTAANEHGQIGDVDFVAQFDAALGKVLAVVQAAGGCPEHVARMTVYVTELDTYLARRAALGDIWKRRMGSHYPAMALVEVSRLVDAGASVEFEAIAAIP